MWEFTYHSRWSQVGFYQGCGLSCSSQESCRRHTSSHSGGGKPAGSGQSWGDIGRLERLPWPFPPAVTLSFKFTCAHRFGILSWWLVVVVSSPGPWHLWELSAPLTHPMPVLSRGQRRLQEWDVFGVMFDSTISEPQMMVCSLQSSRWNLSEPSSCRSLCSLVQEPSMCWQTCYWRWQKERHVKGRACSPKRPLPSDCHCVEGHPVPRPASAHCGEQHGHRC